MYILEGIVVCEMTACHITVTVCAVLRNGSVKVVLFFIIVTKTVSEGRIRVFVNYLVCSVIRISIGSKTDELERFQNSQVHLTSDGICPIDSCSCIIMKFTQDAEAVFRHHLLDSASIVIA